MSVKSFMETHLVVIQPDESITAAAKRMSEHNLGALLVVEDGKLSGIISERDLLKRVVAVGLDPDKTLVRQVATPKPVVVQAGETLAACYQILKEHNFRHLPVVDAEGRPLGVLSTRDLLRHMVVGMEDHVDIGMLCQQIGNLRMNLFGN